MDIKQEFINSLLALPNGVSDFKNTQIPVIPAVDWPGSDVDQAIIAQGQLAANINTLLKAFEGLTPIELFLRIGQYNPVIREMFLSGLRFIGQGLHEFAILQPEGGIIYQPGTITLSIEVTSGLEDFTQAYVQYDTNTVNLVLDEENPGQYKADEDFLAGLHALTFKVEFTVNDGDLYIAIDTIDLDVQP